MFAKKLFFGRCLKSKNVSGKRTDQQKFDISRTKKTYASLPKKLFLVVLPSFFPLFADYVPTTTLNKTEETLTQHEIESLSELRANGN